MIHTLSESISNKLAEVGVLSKNQIAVYIYGFELLFSCCIGIFSVVLLSFVFRDSLLWISYLVAYVPLRANAGGYHAGSHFKCIFLFSMVFIIHVFLVQILKGIILFPIVVSLVSFAVLYFLAPVDIVQNPLKEKYKKICRTRSLTIAGTNVLISFSGTLFAEPWLKYVASYYIGITAAVVFLLVAVIKNKAKKGAL